MNGERAFGSAVLGLWMVVTACYHAHVLSPAPDPLGNPCRRTVHVLAWGLKTSDTKSTYCESKDRIETCKRAGGGDSAVRACKADAERARTATACEQSNAIDQVRVSTNFGYTVLSLLTLGFWSPVQLKWHCAKPQEDEGVIGQARSDQRRAESP